ncbi:MAG TPA: IPT/TIG domain-containing protein, partial [Terriglobales bacterium]|nr:IPT/TIG domain-containing protein [Terriglobales bacterium]
SGNWVMQMATFKSTSSSTAPTVSSVSPNSGPSTGGTAVTISGTNFAAGAVVTFGGTPATNVTVVSGTSITATTPAHAAGTVNVVVTNSDSQSGTLTSGFTYTSSTAIKFVQVNAATPHPSASSVALAFSAAQNAGDLNIVVVGWNDTTSTLQPVSDSAGNTYHLAGTVHQIGSGSGGTALSQAIYYATNIAGGANTVTVTFNQAAAYPDVRVLEYAGVGTLDVSSGATGTSSTSNSGAATTTAANELIFGANMVYTSTTAAGGGFTARIITSPNGDIAEDRIVSSAGTYSASAPLSTSGTWVMEMATFK